MRVCVCVCVCVCACACMCVCACVCMGGGRLHSSQMYVTVKQMQDCGLVDVTQTGRQAGWQTEPNRCVDRLTYELESFSQVH